MDCFGSKPDQRKAYSGNQQMPPSIDPRIRSRESYRFGLIGRARMAAWEAYRRLISEKERRFS